MLVDMIQENGLEHLGRFYSRYRGIVMDNQDPEDKDKLLVYLPQIDIRIWARSAGTIGGYLWGYKLNTPKPGEMVWVEFEKGNITSPVWHYHTWTIGQKPSELEGADTIGIVTPSGHKFILQDQDGILKINLKDGLAIEVDSDNLKVNFGDTSLESDGTDIKINGGDNKGVIKISDLTEKLNQLINELNSLKLSYNTHTHKTIALGSPTDPPPTYTGNFSTFNQSDYEDTHLTH
jgi:hypothetical protein